MKDIRMQRLSLKNFKGIASFDFVPGGEDAAIYGDNATGKTTLVDAFMWLLFGKDSLNQANFEIKPLNQDGEPEHGLEHGVAAQLNISGKVLTLRKVLSEKWTKKRGSATKEFTGHTTDYFVDGVPKPKKDFDAAVAELCDEQLFRLLTNPRYFNEVLHWQKRRELLLQVCGDITDQDIISSDDKLSPLSRIMAERSLEDHQKVLRARRSELNKELEKIPVRIDECQQLIGQPPPEMLSDMDLANLKNQLTIKQNELARLQSGGEIGEKTKRLREVEAQILALETDAKVQYREQQEELHKRKAELTRALTQLQAQILSHDHRIKLTEDRLLTLRAEWVRIDSTEPPVKNTCPACGQSLPAEQVEQAIRSHNETKARELAAISTDGKACKSEVEDLRRQRETWLQEAAEIETQIKAVETDLQIEPKPMDSVEYNKLLAGRELLKNSIEDLSVDTSTVRQEVQAEIDRLRAAIDQQIAWREQEKAVRHARERVEQLKSEERKLAGEFERIEQELSLLDGFIRTKVGLLESKINSRFRLARFKLFAEQINGGVSECCEVMVAGVPYSSLNNAMRINVGLDVIATLSEHYGVRAPIMIDNAEAVTSLYETPAQQIRLLVSETDKSLRIETKQTAKAA